MTYTPPPGYRIVKTWEVNTAGSIQRMAFVQPVGTTSQLEGYNVVIESRQPSEVGTVTGGYAGRGTQVEALQLQAKQEEEARRSNKIDAQLPIGREPTAGEIYAIADTLPGGRTPENIRLVTQRIMAGDPLGSLGRVEARVQKEYETGKIEAYNVKRVPTQFSLASEVQPAEELSFFLPEPKRALGKVAVQTLKEGPLSLRDFEMNFLRNFFTSSDIDFYGRFDVGLKSIERKAFAQAYTTTGYESTREQVESTLLIPIFAVGYGTKAFITPFFKPIETAKGIGQAITNPIETGKDILVEFSKNPVKVGAELYGFSKGLGVIESGITEVGRLGISRLRRSGPRIEPKLIFSEEALGGINFPPAPSVEALEFSFRRGKIPKTERIFNVDLLVPREVRGGISFEEVPFKFIEERAFPKGTPGVIPTFADIVELPRGKTLTFTASSEPLKGLTVTPGPKGAKLIEDPVLYISPVERAMTYFTDIELENILRQKKEIKFSLLPFRDLFKEPTVSGVIVKDVGRLPESVIRTPGFVDVREFLLTQSESGRAFITARTERGLRGIRDLGGTTREFEAGVPLNAELRKITKSFGRGRLAYTDVSGEVINIRLYEVLEKAGKRSALDKLIDSYTRRRIRGGEEAFRELREPVRRVSPAEALARLGSPRDIDRFIREALGRRGPTGRRLEGTFRVDRVLEVERILRTPFDTRIPGGREFRFDTTDRILRDSSTYRTVYGGGSSYRDLIRERPLIEDYDSETKKILKRKGGSEPYYYAPSFSARVLDIEEVISEKQARKLLRQSFTGLEIRPSIRVR